MKNCEKMEKWEDRKYLVFPLVCLVGGVEKWKGGKVEGWKTLLFGCRKKGNDGKCNLYKLIIIPLLHNI